MRINWSYLKHLSLISLLLLGGCIWIVHSEWPNHIRLRDSVSSDQNSAKKNSSTTATDSNTTTNQTDASKPSISHGERLSTLEDEAPIGRVPPDIVQATGDVQRLPQIKPGRSDPFASLPARPYLVQKQSDSRPASPSNSSTADTTGSDTRASAPQPPPVPNSPQTVIPVPIVNQLPSPPLAQSPPPVAAVPTTPIAVAPTPELSNPTASESTNVAHTASTHSFEFSGVVQTGDRVNIIVEEPSGSRYVQVGERVGNGQFIIKSVDFNQGSTPAIILEKGGTETMHWVGTPIAM